jgi:hypothetical protein
MHTQIELREFFVEGAAGSRTHVLLHITEPTTPEEEEHGYFFALAELKETTAGQIRMMQKLIDELELTFYETKASSPVQAFEQTIKRINASGHHILKSNGTLDCITGIIHEDTVAFSYHGDPKAVLFFLNKQGHRQAIHAIAQEEHQGPNQLFSELVEGKIGPTDLFYICSSNTWNEYQEHDLLVSLERYTPEQAIERLETKLSQKKRPDSYGGILCYHGKQPQTPSKTTETTPSLVEQRTEDVQEPIEQITPISKKQEQKAKSKQQLTARPQKKKQRQHSNEQPKVIALVLLLFHIIKTILYSIGRLTVELLVVITNRGKNRPIVLESWKNGLKQIGRAFGGLPLMSKLLLILTLIFGCVFAGSIIYTKYQTAQEIEQSQYEETINAIINKKDAADSAIIYENNEKALTLLNEAQGLIDSLSVDSEEEREQQALLSKEITSSLQKLQRITAVTAIPVVTIDARAQATHLTKMNDQLIAFGEGTELLAYLDLDTSSVRTSTIANPRPFVRGAELAPEGNSTTAQLITRQGELWTVDPESYLLQSTDISYDQTEPVVAAAVAYNDRLYTLLPAEQLILRHSATQTGYGKGTAWITALQADLTDAVDLAIDGNIYVLKANGTIVQFTRGEEQTFALEQVSPTLDSADRVITSAEMDELFILDKTHARVLVFDKQDGRLKAQYQAEEWQTIADIAYNEATKTLYSIGTDHVVRSVRVTIE